VRGVRDGFGGGLTHGQHSAREFARPRREPHGGHTAGDRGVERGDDLGTVEHSVAPDASAMASGSGKASRPDQHQPGESHRQHRACGSADVARMAGRHEDDAEG
jgi:hypothetical protein